jgi:acyl-coenzyme A thioesterase PaaI-like protein
MTSTATPPSPGVGSWPPPHALATPDEINTVVAELWPGGASGVATHTGPTWAIAAYTPEQRLLRPGGIISGPTVFSLADCALWYALFASVGIEPMALTSELSIRYLRPARGTVLYARADIQHAGKRSVIGSVKCWMDSENADDAKPVAVAQGTYVRPQAST